jgi:hypothetical protein
MKNYKPYQRLQVQRGTRANGESVEILVRRASKDHREFLERMALTEHQAKTGVMVKTV